MGVSLSRSRHYSRNKRKRGGVFKVGKVTFVLVVVVGVWLTFGCLLVVEAKKNNLRKEDELPQPGEVQYASTHTRNFDKVAPEARVAKLDHEDITIKPSRIARRDELRAKVRKEHDMDNKNEDSETEVPPPPWVARMHMDVIPSRIKRQMRPPVPPPPLPPPMPPPNATPPAPPPDLLRMGLDPFGDVTKGEAANASRCVRYDEFTCPLLSPRDTGGECRRRAESWHETLNTQCEHGWDETAREYMLKLLEGRLIFFLGDSLMIQQWTSLVCLLGEPVKHWTHDAEVWAGTGTGPTAGCALYRGGTSVCAALEETFEPNGVRGNIGLAARLNRMLHGKPRLLKGSDIVVMGIAGAYGTPQRRMYRAGIRSLAHFSRYNREINSGANKEKGAVKTAIDVPLLVWRVAPASHYPVGVSSAADFEAYSASNFTLELKQRIAQMRGDREAGRYAGAHAPPAPPDAPIAPPKPPLKPSDLIGKESWKNSDPLTQDEDEDGGETGDEAAQGAGARRRRRYRRRRMLDEDGGGSFGGSERFTDTARYGIDAPEQRTVCWSPETGAKLAAAVAGAPPGSGEAVDAEGALWHNEGLDGEFDLHLAGIALLTLHSPGDSEASKLDYLQHPGRLRRHVRLGDAETPGSANAMDCHHYCLPGKPDVWNRRLLNLLVATRGEGDFHDHNVHRDVNDKDRHVFARAAFDAMMYDDLVAQTLMGDETGAKASGTLGMTPEQAMRGVDETMRYEMLGALLRAEAEHRQARANAAKLATELREAGEKLGRAGHENRNFLSEPALFPPGQTGGSHYAESFLHAITMRGVNNSTGIGVTFEVGKQHVRKGHATTSGSACFRWLSAWGGTSSGAAKGSTASGVSIPRVFVSVNFERERQRARWAEFKQKKAQTFDAILQKTCNLNKVKPGKASRDAHANCMEKHENEILREMDLMDAKDGSPTLEQWMRPEGMVELFPEGAGTEGLTDGAAALWHEIGRPWGATGDYVGCVPLPKDGWHGKKNAGKHYTYKFLVDGVWRTSPASEYRVSWDGDVVNFAGRSRAQGTDVDPGGWYLPCVPFHVASKREIYGPMGRIAEGGIASLIHEPFCAREDVLAPATRQWGIQPEWKPGEAERYLAAYEMPKQGKKRGRRH